MRGRGGGILAKTNVPWEGGGGGVANKGKGGRGSKLGNLEQTYFLNALLGLMLRPQYALA